MSSDNAERQPSKKSANSSTTVLITVVIGVILIVIAVVVVVAVIKQRRANAGNAGAGAQSTVSFENPMYDASSGAMGFTVTSNASGYMDVPGNHTTAPPVYTEPTPLNHEHANLAQMQSSAGYMDVNPAQMQSSAGYMDVSPGQPVAEESDDEEV